jgi:hypothetical protein
MGRPVTPEFRERHEPGERYRQAARSASSPIALIPGKSARIPLLGRRTARLIHTTAFNPMLCGSLWVISGNRSTLSRRHRLVDCHLILRLSKRSKAGSQSAGKMQVASGAKPHLRGLS